jgi:hypothetical protein
MSDVAFHLSPALLPYAVGAAAMLALNAFVLLMLFPRMGGVPRLSRAILGLSVLVGSATFTGTFLDAAVSPGFDSATAVLFGSQTMMMVPFIWATSLFLRAGRRRIDPRWWGWPILLSGAMTANEVLMGAAFSAVQGAFPAGSWLGLQGGLGALGWSLASPWFYWPMVGNMLLLLGWAHLPWAERLPLVGLALAPATAPWITVDPWVTAIGMGSAMAVTTIYIAARLAGSRISGIWELRLVLGVVLGFALMALGGGLAALYPIPSQGILAFGLLNLVVMGGELSLLARRLFQPLDVRREASPTPTVLKSPVP